MSIENQYGSSLVAVKDADQKILSFETLEDAHEFASVHISSKDLTKLSFTKINRNSLMITKENDDDSNTSH